MWVSIENVHFLCVLGLLFASLMPAVIFSIDALVISCINENRISRCAQCFGIAYLILNWVAVVLFLLSDSSAHSWHFISLYQHHDVSIFLTLIYDLPTAVFLSVTAFVTNVIVFFSSRYLHRDPGFRRFYLVLFMFLFGVTLLFCAGSFDFVFAAWEIIGISSFLLIGFYWHRPQAVLNAKRAYFTYRVFDVGLLFSAILSQHLWHSEDLFHKLSSGELLPQFLIVPEWEKWLLCMLILLPAIGKSAQFPVSFWLPKAMEGPTPSSAIFYGSISIHAGVFLLIRTSSIWYHTKYFPAIVFLFGIVTAISATLFGRVQTSIKGQIGYASVAQVGVMFVELSLGMVHFALVHFVGNAFLRCFQLLTSSTVITQQLQIHGALEGKIVRNPWSMESLVPKSLRATLYVFSMNEGFIEALLQKYVFLPLQSLGDYLNSVFTTSTHKLARLTGVAPAHEWTHSFRSWIWVPVISSLFVLPRASGISLFLICFAAIVLSAMFALAALSYNCSPLRVVNLVFLSASFATLALMERGIELKGPTLLYAGGVCSSYVLVYVCYRYVLTKRNFDAHRGFAGLFSQFPRASAIGFVGILGLIGFPISTTFFGEDILIEYAVKTGLSHVLLFCAIFILNGITLIRVHSRLFFGARDAHIELTLDMSPMLASTLLMIFLGINLFLLVFV